MSFCHDISFCHEMSFCQMCHFDIYKEHGATSFQMCMPMNSDLGNERLKICKSKLAFIQIRSPRVKSVELEYSLINLTKWPSTKTNRKACEIRVNIRFRQRIHAQLIALINIRPEGPISLYIIT